MEKYKWFNRSVTLKLEHLTEGETINPIEYVEKLQLFKKLGLTGTYIVDKTYTEHGKSGFHYYKLDTLIRYFSKFKTFDKLEIKFRNGNLSCG